MGTKNTSTASNGTKPNYGYDVVHGSAAFGNQSSYGSNADFSASVRYGREEAKNELYNYVQKTFEGHQTRQNGGVPEVKIDGKWVKIVSYSSADSVYKCMEDSAADSSKKNNGKELLDYINGPLLNSISGNIDVGLGFGIKAELFGTGFNATAKRVLTMQQGDLEIWVGNQDKISVGASAGGYKVGYTVQDLQHEFSNECTCWSGDGENCPAWRKRQYAGGPDPDNVSGKIGISLGGYFLVGGEISVSIDLRKLYNETVKFFNTGD